ncbi:hypothetical protein MUP77_00735 [Candidatus Bathyarchaeota archaeon]|jgi:hypothetical protein|nr:hypothetical protein [Candidatus Bathyarchaeota archaeon]
MSLIKPNRCENCGHGEAVKNGSMVLCGLDEASPVQVVWSHWCERWVQEEETNKK